MKEHMYRVAIKDKWYENNVFILGHVAGVARVTFDMVIIQHFRTHAYQIPLGPRGNSMTVRTTKRKFRKFRKSIERKLPGLCDFDTEVDKELIEHFGK